MFHISKTSQSVHVLRSPSNSKLTDEVGLKLTGKTLLDTKTCLQTKHYLSNNPLIDNLLSTTIN